MKLLLKLLTTLFATVCFCACSSSDNDDAMPDGQFNWEYLTEQNWVCEEEGYTILHIFEYDGTFEQSIIYNTGNIISVDGTYKVDKKNNLIYEYTDNGYLFCEYKVQKLTHGILKITSSDRQGNFPEQQTRTYYASDYDLPGSSMDPDIPEKPDTPQSPDFFISEPIIVDISEHSATVKGTIVGEGVTFKERGACYSTTPNPTVQKWRAFEDDVEITLPNLRKGTTYYVRLYAVVNDEIFYGKEVSFTTAGTAVTKVELSCSIVWANDISHGNSIQIKAIIPSEIDNYSICYGTNPNPKITDYTFPVKKRGDGDSDSDYFWLNDLNSATKYYIRFYHMQDSKIIYDEDSEICVETIGLSVKFRGSYSEGKIYFSWEGLENNIYKVSCSSYPKMVQFYIDGSESGSTSIVANWGMINQDLEFSIHNTENNNAPWYSFRVKYNNTTGTWIQP